MSAPWRTGRSAARLRSASLALLLVAAPLAFPSGASGQGGPALTDLAWLAGAWALDRTGERLEEWWSAPVGDSMVGHFRWIRDGELWITELVSITEEEAGIVFRLRHFGAGMRAWEDRDDPFVYLQTESAPGRASFSIVEPRPGRPGRFVFQALPGDSLLVRLEGEEGGRPTSQDFRYGRGR